MCLLHFVITMCGFTPLGVEIYLVGWFAESIIMLCSFPVQNLQECEYWDYNYPGHCNKALGIICSKL